MSGTPYPRDAAYLAARGIPTDDAIRLGYRTVSRAADLHRPADHLRHPNPDKGQWFGKAPRFQGSALEIPIRDASGAIVSCQAVPAQPRLREGEPVKKESMPGARLTLHIPLGVGDILNDPTIPLGWTESPLKADSITLAGQPTFGCCGVDGFKVRNGDKSEPLPELEAIPLAGRVVFLFNDSDLHTGNEGVQGAYRRQCAYVTSRGGTPLDASPPPAADGSKQGPDDFVAAGGKPSELVTLAITRAVSSQAVGSDGAQTCQCTECPDRKLLKVLQRERVERVKLHAVPNLDPAKKLLGERMWSDLRYAAARGQAYRPTNAYFVQRTGLAPGTVKNHIESVRDALGVKVESRTYPPGYRFPSGQVAQNHITERTFAPPDDILERDLVKSLKVLVRADDKRGGNRCPALIADPCENHPDSPGEILRTVVCKVGREPLARLKPITVALRRAPAPEGSKFDPSENDGPPPELPSPFRPHHTYGGAKFDPSGQIDQAGELYQRARDRMAAQPPPPPIPSTPGPVCIECRRPSPRGLTPCWRCAAEPAVIAGASE